MAQVIIPLDVPTLDDAMGLVDSLGEAADFYKVGLELFTAEGSAAVQALKQRNKRVFLDLKLHDIPSTVARAVARARVLEVDLLTLHNMTLLEVAQTLRRSKAWVSMRRGLWEEMSPAIQELLFAGAFPVYSYMYTLRRFRRMNAISADQIERFVQSLAGKQLSVREIELLAQAYFRGPVSLRDAIDAGKFGWSLEQMRNVPEDREGCSQPERVLLKDLQILHKYMRRVMTKCADSRLASRGFYAQANLLAGGLLSSLQPFQERIQEFHDRSGHA